jgi:hypothetical protein
MLVYSFYDDLLFFFPFFPFLGIQFTSLSGMVRCGALTSLPLLRRLLPSLPSLLLQTPSIFTSCQGTLERATAQKSNKIYAPEKRSENGFFCDIKDDSSLLGQKNLFSIF